LKCTCCKIHVTLMMVWRVQIRDPLAKFKFSYFTKFVHILKYLLNSNFDDQKGKRKPLLLFVKARAILFLLKGQNYSKEILVVLIIEISKFKLLNFFTEPEFMPADMLALSWQKFAGLHPITISIQNHHQLSLQQWLAIKKHIFSLITLACKKRWSLKMETNNA